MKTKFETGISFEKSRIFPRKYRNLRNISHWHREHELVYVEEGSASVMEDGNFLTLNKGECAFLCSEVIHSIQSENGAITIVAKLDADYFDGIVGRKRPISPVLTHDYNLSAVFDELFSELSDDLEFNGIIADSLARRLVAQIFRTEKTAEISVPQRSSSEKYKSLLDLITERYADITFDDAAEYMHFSKPYFSKFFYQHAGVTFTEYLNMIRVNAAAELVLDGKLTVTEISRRCGFNTIRNFNRVFKAVTGYAPSELPRGYDLIHNLKKYAENGFDPTLNCTEVLA